MARRHHHRVGGSPTNTELNRHLLYCVRQDTESDGVLLLLNSRRRENGNNICIPRGIDTKERESCLLRAFLEDSLQELAGVGGVVLSDLFGGALGDDEAAVVAALAALSYGVR